MSKKHLLNEETVRKFMGLAGLKPITVSDFVNEEYVEEDTAVKGDDMVVKACPGGDGSSCAGGKGKCQGGKCVPLQEENLEEEVDLEEDMDEDLYEQDEEPPMGDEEEPPMEDEPEMDMEEEPPAEEEKEVTIDPEEAEVLVSLADKLRAIVGDAEEEVPGEEEGLPPEEEVPGEEEELGMAPDEEEEEEEEPEAMMENLVNRIASRVAKRILKSKKS